MNQADVFLEYYGNINRLKLFALLHNIEYILQRTSGGFTTNGFGYRGRWVYYNTKNPKSYELGYIVPHSDTTCDLFYVSAHSPEKAVKLLVGWVAYLRKLDFVITNEYDHLELIMRPKGFPISYNNVF